MQYELCVETITSLPLRFCVTETEIRVTPFRQSLVLPTNSSVFADGGNRHDHAVYDTEQRLCGRVVVTLGLELTCCSLESPCRTT